MQGHILSNLHQLLDSLYIGATIRIGQEIQCLRYAGFKKLIIQMGLLSKIFIKVY